MAAHKRTFIGIWCDWPGCSEHLTFCAQSNKRARKKAILHGWSACRKGNDRCPKHRGLNIKSAK